MVALKSQRGQALVEMAVALLVLILVLGGIIEFGRIFHTKLLLTQAAREGVRVGVVGGDDEKIKAAVKKMAPQVQNIEIHPPENQRTPGQELKVTLFQEVRAFLLATTYKVEVTARMQMEKPPA